MMEPRETAREAFVVGDGVATASSALFCSISKPHDTQRLFSEYLYDSCDRYVPFFVIQSCHLDFCMTPDHHTILAIIPVIVLYQSHRCLAHAEVPMSSRLATSVLTGLINRKLGAPSILALINGNDPLWEEQLLQQDSLYGNATYRILTGLPELFEMALEQGRTAQSQHYPDL